MNSDETVLVGRAASTPQGSYSKLQYKHNDNNESCHSGSGGGPWSKLLKCHRRARRAILVYVTSHVYTGLAESISFNISSAIPPSPIPPTASVDSYTTRPTRKSTRRSTRKSASVQNVKVATSSLATGGVNQATGRGSGRPGRKESKNRRSDCSSFRIGKAAWTGWSGYINASTQF